MFAIQLNDLGKRYRREWIFRHLSHAFVAPKQYALLGPNGSGKSTLMQLIAGSLQASEGEIVYRTNNTLVPAEKIYQYIAWAAPAIELIEEFTLEEIIAFQTQFKPLRAPFSPQSLIAYIGLEKAKGKLLREFSSGMKQRVKLALSVCADTPVLLLDEPTTNLDTTGIALYKKMMHEQTQGRLCIIASNQTHEYEFCDEQIHVGTLS